MLNWESGDINMISIDKVDCSNAIFYSNFTFNKFFELITKSSNNVIAFGADYDSEPCGLIVAESVKDEKNIWAIRSLFVKKQFRRKGAGTALVKKTLEELKQKNCKTLIFKAITSQKSIDELSALLIPLGFSPLEKLTTVYKFNAKDLIQSSKFIKAASAGLFKLPEKIHILSIDKVDSKLISELKEKSTIDYPEELSPFANEYNLKTDLSYFALTDKNEIVGWLTAFSSEGNIILYRSFFVKEEYRKTAVGFFLFNEAVKNHAAKHPDNACLFAIARDNFHAERFVLSYFKGTNYEHKKYEFKTTFKVSQPIDTQIG